MVQNSSTGLVGHPDPGQRSKILVSNERKNRLTYLSSADQSVQALN